jgi:putative ABC transport system substrate-binding protein
VTGSSDRINVKDHLALFVQIAPIRTLGYIYTASEANSISALQDIERTCADLGITLVAQAITTSADLRQAAEAIVNRVDGIYLTTDNTVFSALSALVQVFNRAGKPIFSGDVTGALAGGIMIASGFNYYKAGYVTGGMVADVLTGVSVPEETPVRFFTDPSETDLLLDLDAAAACGITIPEYYLSAANYIFQNGRLTER